MTVKITARVIPCSPCPYNDSLILFNQIKDTIEFELKWGGNSVEEYLELTLEIEKLLTSMVNVIVYVLPTAKSIREISIFKRLQEIREEVEEILSPSVMFLD